MKHFVCTDESLDVLASLQHCTLSLTQTQHSDGAWKWAILSFHSAFQGAMVCHLSGTAQLGALKKNSAEKWLDWYERDRLKEHDCEAKDDAEFDPFNWGSARGEHPPNEYIAEAPVLFSRLDRSSARLENGCGEVICISDTQKNWFGRLNNLRNHFTHFQPKGWSIEIVYLKQSISNVLEVFEVIANDPWPFRNLTDNELEDLKLELKKIRRFLS